MAITISNDDNDVIKPVTINACLGHTFNDLILHSLEERAKVARTGKRRTNNALLVRVENLHGAVAARILLSVEVPESADLALVSNVMRNTSKAIDVEAFILRILAHDVAYLKDSFLVLVHLTMAHLAMKGVLVSDLKVAQSEINCDRHLHLPALRQELEQTRSHIHFKLIEYEMANFFALLVVQDNGFGCSHFDQTCRRLGISVHFVGAIIAVIVDGETQREHLVIVAELCHEELMRLPPWTCLVVRSVRLPYLHHIANFILTGALNHQVRGIRAEAEELFGL